MLEYMKVRVIAIKNVFCHEKWKYSTDCKSVLTEQPVPFSAFDFDNQPGSSSMFRSHVMRDDEFHCADSQAGGFN